MMESLTNWRIRKMFNEIAVSTNPDHIIKGAPTLDSIKEGIWGDSKVPPNIPTSEVEPIANGNKQIPTEENEEHDEKEPNSTAPSVNNGGLVSQPNYDIKKSGPGRLITFKDLDDALARKKALGYLGSRTFNSAPVPAGENPTISHGIPVGEPTGQF